MNMKRTHGFRELPREEQLRQFSNWLPEALHDAPGICWEDLPGEVMAYAVRALCETPNAAPLAVAAVVSLLGLVLTLTTLPEPNQQSLEEISGEHTVLEEQAERVVA